MDLTKRQHIGDGAYVEHDGYHLIVSANVPVSDKVYLDYYGQIALYKILKELLEVNKEQNEK